jgi:hypothetical protein
MPMVSGQSVWDCCRIVVVAKNRVGGEKQTSASSSARPRSALRFLNTDTDTGTDIVGLSHSGDSNSEPRGHYLSLSAHSISPQPFLFAVLLQCFSSVASPHHFFLSPHLSAATPELFYDLLLFNYVPQFLKQAKRSTARHTTLGFRHGFPPPHCQSLPSRANPTLQLLLLPLVAG